jgi:CHAT domain-containing protein
MKLHVFRELHGYMKYEFYTYDNNDQIKADLLQCLTYILEEYSCSIIKMPIYTCLNELLVNAIKANFKNLYFEEYAPQNNALEIIPYHKALQLFKLEMSTNRVDYLTQLAKEKDIKAMIELSVDEKNDLTILVKNPSTMTKVESENVKKKIELANTYDTLSEYFIYSENDPNKEGGGLGIIFYYNDVEKFWCNNK